VKRIGALGLAAVLATTALAMTAHAASSPAPAALPAAAPSSLYTLTFDDEFNGTAVDTSKWNYRTDVRGWSAQRPQNVTEGGGLMTINLKKESYGGMSYTGGGLVSKQAFHYGYYETRVRTNVGSGWHPSFWAMASDGSTTNWPDRRTEIDGFEMDSHRPTVLSHNINPWLPDGSREPTISSGNYNVGFDMSAAFHTYGFEWTENQVKYYVDGALKFTASYSPTCCTKHDYINAWLSAIAINLNNSPGVDESKLPGTVQWDYFRYYAKDGYTDNDGPSAYRYSETGGWATSTQHGYTLENTSRYSTEAGATARWRSWQPAAGTYDVYLYKIVSSDSDAKARAEVAHNGGTSTVAVDFTSGSTGWVKLGTWQFGAGESGSVTLTAGGPRARADAVKVVRVA
jgi:beta-glucanase (GH16 family)